MCVLCAGTFGSFIRLLAAFVALFRLTGVGNASTFRMIAAIMGREVPPLMPELEGNALRGRSERESAAIIALTNAIAACGALFIPKAFGSSIATTGFSIVARRAVAAMAT